MFSIPISLRKKTHISLDSLLVAPRGGKSVSTFAQPFSQSDVFDVKIGVHFFVSRLRAWPLHIFHQGAIDDLTVGSHDVIVPPMRTVVVTSFSRQDGLVVDAIIMRYWQPPGFYSFGVVKTLMISKLMVGI